MTNTQNNADMPESKIMNEQQIKHMVSRFLGWKLPENFRPDGGVSFEPLGNKGTPHEFKRDTSGTNLFDYEQATEMVRYIIDGMEADLVPPPSPVAEGDKRKSALSAFDACIGAHCSGCEVYFSDEQKETIRKSLSAPLPGDDLAGMIEKAKMTLESVGICIDLETVHSAVDEATDTLSDVLNKMGRAPVKTLREGE